MTSPTPPVPPAPPVEQLVADAPPAPEPSAETASPPLGGPVGSSLDRMVATQKVDQMAAARADAAPATEVAPVAAPPVRARFDVTKAEPKWPHAVIDFHGDRIGVRVPTDAALAALHFTSGKHVPDGLKTEMSSAFIVQHLSSESYGHIMAGIMNPDNSDYTLATFQDLFTQLIELTDTPAASPESTARS